MLAVTLAIESTLRLCRLVRAPQLAGRAPVTARCETSSTIRVVRLDQVLGNGPLTPTSRLTLRKVREERADQAEGRVPVRLGAWLASRLTSVEMEAIAEGREPTRPETGERGHVKEGRT